MVQSALPDLKEQHSVLPTLFDQGVTGRVTQVWYVDYRHRIGAKHQYFVSARKCSKKLSCADCRDRTTVAFKI
jgi:hypothetical protein